MLARHHHFLSNSSSGSSRCRSLRVCGLLWRELFGVSKTAGNCTVTPNFFQPNMLEATSNSLSRTCILHLPSKSEERYYRPQVLVIVGQSRLSCISNSISSGTWKKLVCRRGLCCSSKPKQTKKNGVDGHAHGGVSSYPTEPTISKEVDRRGEKQGVSSVECGGLHLILGPMFAGKTTALLRRIQAEADAGRIVTLAKSDKDTRYGINAVVSHDGIQMPCMAVSDLKTFKEKLGKLYSEVEVIGIDEAQFFNDLVEFCKVAADVDGKTVIVAGLDGDFLRRKFGFAVDLIPLADTVTKLSSRCEICGHPAAFTLRKTQDMEKEVIGGAEVYMPVCRRHYIAEQMSLKSASLVQDELQANVL